MYQQQTKIFCLIRGQSSHFFHSCKACMAGGMSQLVLVSVNRSERLPLWFSELKFWIALAVQINLLTSAKSGPRSSDLMGVIASSLQLLPQTHCNLYRELVQGWAVDVWSGGTLGEKVIVEGIYQKWSSTLSGTFSKLFQRMHLCLQCSELLILICIYIFLTLHGWRVNSSNMSVYDRHLGHTLRVNWLNCLNIYCNIFAVFWQLQATNSGSATIGSIEAILQSPECTENEFFREPIERAISGKTLSIPSQLLEFRSMV